MAEPVGRTAPQFGIFAQGSTDHCFLEFDLRKGSAPDGVKRCLRRLLAPSATSGTTNIVLAFGSTAWQILAPGGSPPQLSDFVDIEGRDGRRVPAAQHDLWVWLSGGDRRAVSGEAKKARAVLEEIADLGSEQVGAIRGENRDMGFLDGTANPPLHRAADVALVPEGQTGRGGSFVLAMKWMHRMATFDKLSLGSQEAVFGRTKKESIEMPEATRPRDAHISRVTLKEDGEELKIFRRSVPFGTPEAQEGLYFLAFAWEPTRYGKMLARMFGLGGDGVRDRLTDFTRPVGGAYYFAPSLNELGVALSLPPE